MLKHILQWLWQYTNGIRLRLLLNCLIGITRVIAGLLFIYISKQLIDMATIFLNDLYYLHHPLDCVLAITSCM